MQMDLPPNSFCGNCLKKRTGKKLRRCCKCKRAHYCSRNCQVADWKKRHKDVCVKKFMDGMMQHNEMTQVMGLPMSSFKPQNLPKSLLKSSTFAAFFARKTTMPKVIGRMVFSYLTGYRSTFRVLDLKLDWFVRDFMETDRTMQLKENRFDDGFFAKNGVGFSLIRDSLDAEFGDVIEVLQNVTAGGKMCGGHINCGFARFDLVKSQFTPKHYAAFLRCVARFLGFEPHCLVFFGMSWSVSADVGLRKAILEAMQRENDRETGRKIETDDDFYEPSADVNPDMDADLRRAMQEYGMFSCHEQKKLMHAGGAADLFANFR